MAACSSWLDLFTLCLSVISWCHRVTTLDHAADHQGKTLCALAFIPRNLLLSSWQVTRSIRALAKTQHPNRNATHPFIKLFTYLKVLVESTRRRQACWHRNRRFLSCPSPLFGWIGIVFFSWGVHQCTALRKSKLRSLNAFSIPRSVKARWSYHFQKN